MKGLFRIFMESDQECECFQQTDLIDMMARMMSISTLPTREKRLGF